MKRATRGSGAEPTVSNLFGLDDVVNDKKPKAPKKSAKGSKKPVVLIPPPTGNPGAEVAEGAPPPPPPAPPVPTQTAPPGITPLSKKQWRCVRQFRMLDYWVNSPDVKTFRVDYPSVVDGHYFWLYWDTPDGRLEKDKNGYSVSDLNKLLLDGHLSFKLKNTNADAPFITVLPAGYQA